LKKSPKYGFSSELRLEILGFPSLLLKPYPAHLVKKKVPSRPVFGGEKAPKQNSEIKRFILALLAVKEILFTFLACGLTTARQLSGSISNKIRSFFCCF
jgi:hypothetical protein